MSHGPEAIALELMKLVAGAEGKNLGAPDAQGGWKRGQIFTIYRDCLAVAKGERTASEIRAAKAARELVNGSAKRAATIEPDTEPYDPPTTPVKPSLAPEDRELV